MPKEGAGCSAPLRQPLFYLSFLRELIHSKREFENLWQSYRRRLQRGYDAPSFIARTEVDANDVVKPAEGSGVAPGLGRAGPSLAGGDPSRPWDTSEPNHKSRAPRRLTSHFPIHIRGVSASGLRPPSPQPEAHGRWTTPFARYTDCIRSSRNCAARRCPSSVSLADCRAAGGATALTPRSSIH